MPAHPEPWKLAHPTARLMLAVLLIVSSSASAQLGLGGSAALEAGDHLVIPQVQPAEALPVPVALPDADAALADAQALAASQLPQQSAQMHASAQVAIPAAGLAAGADAGIEAEAGSDGVGLWAKLKARVHAALDIF